MSDRVGKRLAPMTPHRGVEQSNAESTPARECARLEKRPGAITYPF